MTTAHPRTPLTALALNCTLKPSPADSSAGKLAQQVLDHLAEHGVAGSMVRAVDLDLRPGVETDMGEGDEWPTLRRLVQEADILVLATPIWLGHMSSVAQRVLERLDAELSETDDQGRPSMFDKVAVVAVVGNEDGAHAVSAAAFQALSDIGFSVPAQGATYWVGEAMQGTDYQDLDTTPEPTAGATRMVARNAAHLARLLTATPYPAG
jgi:multimeric flavodoxin WrbA